MRERAYMTLLGKVEAQQTVREEQGVTAMNRSVQYCSMVRQLSYDGEKWPNA